MDRKRKEINYWKRSVPVKPSYNCKPFFSFFLRDTTCRLFYSPKRKMNALDFCGDLSYLLAVLLLLAKIWKTRSCAGNFYYKICLFVQHLIHEKLFGRFLFIEISRNIHLVWFKIDRILLDCVWNGSPRMDINSLINVKIKLLNFNYFIIFINLFCC